MPISVVMPAFNAERYIGDAIASVLAQTGVDWELIVVDDGSTDRTLDVARAVADSRIRVVASGARHGVAAARNRGTALARHDIVNYLDADDRLAAHALKTLEDALAAHPQVGVVYANYVRITSDGRRFGSRRFIQSVARPDGDVLEAFLRQNRIVNGGIALVRTDLVREVGGWNAQLRSSSDWALWSLIAAKAPFLYLPGVVALEYRELPTGITQRINRTLAAYEPAIDFVFRHPLVTARFDPRALARLRRAAESHACSLLAAQAVRKHEWSASLKHLGEAVRRSPPDFARAGAKYALALGDVLC